MRASGGGKSLCHKAKEYYYELLRHDDTAVPEAIVRHVAGCSFCQQQIHRLKDTLSQSDHPSSPSDGLAGQETVEVLGRQFEFLGQHVRCSHARPFLPDLLAPSPPIRIPTPITVHVENCPQCTQDLASIRELSLTGDQLKRLGRFYDASVAHNPSHDGHAYSTAAALALFSLDGTDPEDLDHASRCPPCRAWIYHQRARALAHLHAGHDGSGVLLCHEVSTADMFDYVMPFGLDAATVGKADGRRDAVATHVRACRRCMETVQSLHRTIYEIADRADSAVDTLYQCDEGTEAACEEARGPSYRYPIHVHVLQGEPAPAAGVGGPSPAGNGFEPRSGARSKARPFVRRTAFATAAAVLVMAVLFLANSPIATGMNVGDLFKTVNREANVHITRWDSGASQPTYELWVSGDLNKIARKIGNEYTEYDIKNQYMRVGNPDLGLSAPIELSQEHIDRCMAFADETLRGIFQGVPADDEFSLVESVPSGRPGVVLSVHELTGGTYLSNDTSVLHRWKVSIDPELRLPVRIEHSTRISEDLPWGDPVDVMSLNYPTTPEMDKTFRALSAGK